MIGKDDYIRHTWETFSLGVVGTGALMINRYSPNNIECTLSNKDCGTVWKGNPQQLIEALQLGVFALALQGEKEK